MKIKGNLIVISGPSGSGKGTVCRSMFNEISDLHLSISATTRKPRSGEADGVHYYFLSREHFEKRIASDQLLEWAEVYGYYYGTPKEQVCEAINRGKDVILEIDVQGALHVKSKFPDCVMIFLLPPSSTELELRLKNRGTDSPEEIKKRLQWAEQEIKEFEKYDYLVINDEVCNAVQKVCAIINAERCRPTRLDVELIMKRYW